MVCRPVARRASFLFVLPGRTDTHLSGALIALGFALACSGGDSPKVKAEDAPTPANLTGRYELSGVTTTAGSEHKRKIQGTIVLEQKGEEYSASYEFKTNFPGEGPPVDADVIGVGEGDIQGRKLVGTARTQIVVSAVPGVDTGFAFVPRMVSARIVSNSVAEFQDDGMIVVEIESRADEGELDYQTTRTRMRGKRIGDIGAKPLGKKATDPRG